MILLRIDLATPNEVLNKDNDPASATNGCHPRITTLQQYQGSFYYIHGQ